MPSRVALFAPCYVDQLHAHVAIAAFRVLERLGLQVDVPEAAGCCGQPMANAGFTSQGQRVLGQLVRSLDAYERVVVLSGSCTAHVRAHAPELGGVGAGVARRVVEFTTFVHDEVGLERIMDQQFAFAGCVAPHVGCHALRVLSVARPSEVQSPPYNKLRAVLGAVAGLSFAEPARPDECCGFGGTFAVVEPAVSVKMGRDRLRDYRRAAADLVVSTDVSCLMHLRGIGERRGDALPVLHLAELLDAASRGARAGPR